MADVALSNDPPGNPQPCPQCGWGLNAMASNPLETCPRCGAPLDPQAFPIESDAPSSSPDDTQSVSVEEVLFEQARALEGEERREFLEKACADDQRLLHRIASLITASEGDDSLLDLPRTENFGEPGDRSHDAGRLIGNYKLLEKIGEGGMGCVYLAEQTKPVQRKVALKLIRAGMDSGQVVARFEAERQSLAMMDHPNIAKVLDAGESDRGEPYFVMELVKGLPITEYCDANRLGPEERVELMIAVCGAVQHAHQKGIIHRDLKPSNILVAQYDDRPVPKVIDFGVAKATHQKLTEKTLYTQLGQIVGTLEYMSPEQAVLNQLDVDTRSDVYSLGVVLYELLVGETPLSGKELRSQGLEQMLRTIREKEPQRPSLRLSSQGKAATQTAAYRHTDQSALSKTLRGDLDWIVMRALEKDRKRRFQSASQLSEDLRRYLEGEIVEARPPSTIYRFQKFWQLHKTLTLSAFVIGAALVAVIFGVAWQSEQRKQALVEKTDAIEQLSQAVKERDTALKRWRVSLIERGIEAALRGDVKATREIASEAQAANAPPEWIHMLQGLAFQNSGNTRQARLSLKKAIELAPNSQAIASALVMASIGDQGAFTANNDTASAMIERLPTLKPSEEYREYDLLLRSWSQLYEDPTESVETLRRIADRDPPWAIAQTMLAMALVHEAADTGERQIAIEALETIRKCEDELDNNPFALFVSLDCRAIAYLFAADHYDSDVLIDEANEIAERLDEFPNGWAIDFRAGYYELIKHPRTKATYRKTRNDWWSSNRAAYMLRNDEEFLRAHLAVHPHESPLQSVGEATALAILGDVSHARRIYDAISKLEAWPVRLASLEILLSIGDEDSLNECMQQSRVYLEDLRSNGDFFDPPFWVFEKRLRYLAQEDGFDDEKFLESVKGSKFGECYANYLIAMHLRARDDPRAETFFQQCVATKQFWMWHYQFSTSILEREYAPKTEQQPKHSVRASSSSGMSIKSFKSDRG